MTRILSKIIIFILSLWAAVILIAEIFGVTIYFPFNVVDRQEIPYHRINAVRLSVFLTFIYFGVRYLFFQTDKMYPVQFLDVYLKSITICSFAIFYSMEVEFREYYFAFFFLVMSTIIHFASKKRIRSYFN